MFALSVDSTVLELFVLAYGTLYKMKLEMKIVLIALKQI